MMCQFIIGLLTEEMYTFIHNSILLIIKTKTQKPNCPTLTAASTSSASYHSQLSQSQSLILKSHSHILKIGTKGYVLNLFFLLQFFLF